MIKRYCDKCGKEITGAAYDVTLDVNIVEEKGGSHRLDVGKFAVQLNFCVDCLRDVARNPSAFEKQIKKAMQNS